MRELDCSLFPLSTVGAVTQLFRQQLSGPAEPDLALLSIVAGSVENSLTMRSVPGQQGPAVVTEYTEPEVADVENLRLEPPLELNIVQALYSKFESIMRGYCELSGEGGAHASRALVKRVSDIIWNTLAKNHYKDRPHLQSLYSYLTGGKLDCFGAAFAVVAGCQLLGFSDVHLAVAEDHAWVVFGPAGETAEVTWHGRGAEDRRGQPVQPDRAAASWLYCGGRPVVCSRAEEVAALVSGMSPAIAPALDSLEVGVLQQELLWLLRDLGHLDRYPMALGNLADLEEVSPSPGRVSSQLLHEQAVGVAVLQYGDHHVYPYTYLAGHHYRLGQHRQALHCWAAAASVIRRFVHVSLDPVQFITRRYNYSKDDEEIYKEFMEINNELIPHILKADESVVGDPECFTSLVQFYDGLCGWEEDSSTPVLHIGWVKPIVKSVASFDFEVRSKLTFTMAEKDEGNTEVLSFDEQRLTCVPEAMNNNNYKKSLNDCDIECDKTSLGHYKYLYRENNYIYQEPPPHFSDFEKMRLNHLLRFASETGGDFCDVRPPHSSASKNKFIKNLLERSGDQMINLQFLLGKPNSQPFVDVDQIQNIETLCQFESDEKESPTKLDIVIEEKNAKKEVRPKKRGGKKTVVLFSAKMIALKDLLQAEKLNSSALHLQLTAQSQTEVKKSRTGGLEQEQGRVKRARRE